MCFPPIVVCVCGCGLPLASRLSHTSHSSELCTNAIGPSGRGRADQTTSPQRRDASRDDTSDVTESVHLHAYYWTVTVLILL